MQRRAFSYAKRSKCLLLTPRIVTRSTSEIDLDPPRPVVPTVRDLWAARLHPSHVVIHDLLDSIPRISQRITYETQTK